MRGGGSFLSSGKAFLEGSKNKKTCYYSDVIHQDDNGVCLKKMRGFTLAEVLITLGIIGVVAALTLPVLVANYRKNVISTQLQKDYAVLQNALKYSESKHGDVKDWDAFSPYPYGNDIMCDINSFIYRFLEGVNTIKIFDGGVIEQKTSFPACGTNAEYSRINQYGNISSATGDARQKSASALMPSGSCWIFYFRAESHQKNLIRVYLDVNGANKKPNRAGIDLFNFIITTNGQIIPNTDDDCHPEQKNDKGIGLGCTAKIMSSGWKFTDDYPFNW